LIVTRGADAEGEAAGFEALDGSGGMAEDGPVVAGVDIGEFVGGGFQFGQEGGSEAASQRPALRTGSEWNSS
jgi:hypothetical protein